MLGAKGAKIYSSFSFYVNIQVVFIFKGLFNLFPVQTNQEI